LICNITKSVNVLQKFITKAARQAVNQKQTPFHFNEPHKKINIKLKSTLFKDLVNSHFI